MIRLKIPPAQFLLPGKISGVRLPFLSLIFPIEQFQRLKSFLKSPLHCLYREFESLPSGQGFSPLKARSNRVRKSFISQAIKFLKAHRPADESSV